MNRNEKLLVSLTIAVMLMLTMLTAVPISAMAEDTSTGITLGAGKIVKGNLIWFGSFNYHPVLWQVLGSGTGGSGMLLISSGLLENIHFNSEHHTANANQWQGSKAQEWCTSFYNDWYNWTSYLEKTAILATSVSDSSFYYRREERENIVFGAAPLSKEYFFFLSAKEADTYFSSDDERMGEGAYRQWWLRSPNANWSSKVGIVDDDGTMSYDGVINHRYARPAFNLKPSSILFTTEIVPYSSKSYQLTMTDINLNISISPGKRASRKGNILTVPYTISGSDKKDGTKAYVMVTDKAYTVNGANVLQYTELSSGVKTDTGTFTLDSSINGIWGADYHVYLLAVNENGEMKTDFASVPMEFHAHSFKYEANGATVTASCETPECELATGQTLTLSAPTNLTYDGQPKIATLNTDYNTIAFPDTYTISYEGTGSTVFENSTTAPTNAGAYKATVMVGTAVAEVCFTINKAELSITAKDQTFVYNGQVQGPGDAVYEDPAEISEKVTVSGLKGSDAITSIILDGQGKDAKAYDLVPSGVTIGEATNNYNITYVNGMLMIAPANVTLTANSEIETYDGTPKSVTGFISSVVGLTFADTVTASGNGTNAGEYDVTFSGVTVNTTRDSTGNYVVSEMITGKLEITQASGLIVALEGSSHTYNGSAKAIANLPSSNAAGGTTNYTYSFEESGTYVNDLSSLTKTDAGTYTVYVKAMNLNYRNIATTTASLTINKADPNVIAPTAKTMIYNGQAQELIKVGSTNDGALYYAVTTENTYPMDALYTTSIPKGTEAGAYYVWFKVVGDENHTDTEPTGPLKAMIAFTFGTPDITLPAFLKAIEAEAFEGVVASVVEVPAGCEFIGDRAFQNCLNLRQIRIPKDCMLGTDVFDGCELVCVYGTENSSAEAYCNDPAHDNCVFVVERQK